MTFLHASDCVSLDQMPFLRSLTTQKRRPNLLVVCQEGSIDAAVCQVRALCTPPTDIFRLPGSLALPMRAGGTILLSDVSELTIGQQLELYDWMTLRPDVQVVSFTKAPLLSFVEAGHFLEGLFYRLNTVCILGHGRPGATVRRPLL